MQRQAYASGHVQLELHQPVLVLCLPSILKSSARRLPIALPRQVDHCMPNTGCYHHIGPFIMGPDWTVTGRSSSFVNQAVDTGQNPRFINQIITGLYKYAAGPDCHWPNAYNEPSEPSLGTTCTEPGYSSLHGSIWYILPVFTALWGKSAKKRALNAYLLNTLWHELCLAQLSSTICI